VRIPVSDQVRVPRSRSRRERSASLSQMDIPSPRSSRTSCEGWMLDFPLDRMESPEKMGTELASILVGRRWSPDGTVWSSDGCWYSLLFFLVGGSVMDLAELSISDPVAPIILRRLSVCFERDKGKDCESIKSISVLSMMMDVVAISEVF